MFLIRILWFIFEPEVRRIRIMKKVSTASFIVAIILIVCSVVLNVLGFTYINGAHYVRHYGAFMQMTYTMTAFFFSCSLRSHAADRIRTTAAAGMRSRKSRKRRHLLQLSRLWKHLQRKRRHRNELLQDVLLVLIGFPFIIGCRKLLVLRQPAFCPTLAQNCNWLPEAVSPPAACFLSDTCTKLQIRIYTLVHAAIAQLDRATAF